MPRSPLVVTVAAVVLLAALGAGVTVYLAGGDDAPATTELSVEWGGTEDEPGCLYQPDSATVTARLVVAGEAAGPTEVTLTVTAYADENTSRPVGSATRTVEVDGTVHELLELTVPVDSPPHVGDDEDAACARTVDY